MDDKAPARQLSKHNTQTSETAGTSSSPIGPPTRDMASDLLVCGGGPARQPSGEQRVGSRYRLRRVGRIGEDAEPLLVERLTKGPAPPSSAGRRRAAASRRGSLRGPLRGLGASHRRSDILPW